MNRTSRTDEPYEGELEGYNQSPNPLSPELTTNRDLNGLVNARAQRDGGQGAGLGDDAHNRENDADPAPDEAREGIGRKGLANGFISISQPLGRWFEHLSSNRFPHASRPPSFSASASTAGLTGQGGGGAKSWTQSIKHGLLKFFSFVGPGFMVAVAYIDPGNYSTGVAAGATYQFRLLFIVLLANIFAIFLQILCIKLGTVSGLNLAEACRAFLPRWVNYGLYFFAEVAIIATDIAEASSMPRPLLSSLIDRQVIGFAIGLNLLIPAIPLVAGCAISILDVMLILVFYQPDKSMRALRIFEFFIVALVLGVVVCFCIQLSLVHGTSVGSVFRGYLPSSAIIEQQGLYQACGILGATVMPHSLYLGSGIVQPRLRDYDAKHGLLPEETTATDDDEEVKDHYTPSLDAIKYSYRISALELALALFTFALFVNSAILIVSGISLYNNADAPEADIFSIHRLLSNSISPAAGTVFALALLLSGVSAGVVCTITGQMVCEGALHWRLRPWLRRLVTRSISIIPSVVIAAAVGRSGLNDALNGSQVVLSVVLPFVTAPLIYFTCSKKHMKVSSGRARLSADADGQGRGVVDPAAAESDGPDSVDMANPWYITIFAVLLWLVIAVLNVANLVLLGLGQ